MTISFITVWPFPFPFRRPPFAVAVCFAPPAAMIPRTRVRSSVGRYLWIGTSRSLATTAQASAADIGPYRSRAASARWRSLYRSRPSIVSRTASRSVGFLAFDDGAIVDPLHLRDGLLRPLEPVSLTAHRVRRRS